MEPPENGDSRDAALRLARTRDSPLCESLLWTRLVVEADELGDEVSEVVPTEDGDVVEEIPTQGTCGDRARAAPPSSPA